MEDRSGGRVNCSHFARGRAPRSAPLSKSARSIGNRSQIGTNCNPRSNREIPPVFRRIVSGSGTKDIKVGSVSIRKIIAAGFISRKCAAKVFRAKPQWQAFYRCLSRLFLVFLSRTIVSIYIYFQRRRVFCRGESLDPPQFRPILTSIERFGVIRCCIPRRGDEFRSNRGSFYFVRHVYIVRAASMRTQECIHRRRRSDWVKINCSELQLCMESVSEWSVIFNALIWSCWGNVSRWDPAETEEEGEDFFFGIDGVGCLVGAKMKEEKNIRD